MALDFGITELEFWEMTPLELNRAIKSKDRIMKIEAQEQAYYDYMQAQLITKGIAILLGDKKPFPSIQEAYPELFKDAGLEEKAAEQKAAQTAAWFKQFAQTHNEKYKKNGGAKRVNE